MTLTLDQLKNAFKKNDSEGGNRPNNYFPFWDMKNGEQALIRFLPDKNPDNPLGFMKEKLMHTLSINGENKSVPCLKMYNEDCDICKVSSQYYKAEDKANGKKYWRKKQHLAQALILSDPLPPSDTGETHEGKVRFLALGYQLFNVIKEAFESGDLDSVPCSFEEGYDFVIKKSQQGEYSTYAVGSKFKPKPSSLDEEIIEFCKEHMVDLATLLPANPGSEKVAAMLEASMTGKQYESNGADSDNSDDVDDDAEATPSRKATPVVKQKTTEAKTEVKTEVNVDADSEADDILKKIRERRSAKA